MVAGALGILGFALHAWPSTPPAPVEPQHLALVVLTVPGTEHSYFAPGNFTVSSAGEVVVTVMNYDTMPAWGPGMAGQVRGVVGGTETVYATLSSAPQKVTELAPGTYGHTLSISDGTYDINAPIPAATSPSAPSEVVFTLYLPHPGTYTWWCGAMCGPLPMGLGGGMAGVLTVTS